MGTTPPIHGHSGVAQRVGDMGPDAHPDGGTAALCKVPGGIIWSGTGVIVASPAQVATAIGGGIGMPLA